MSRRQGQEKICFGSGCSRDTSSKKGMSSFMRHYSLEEYPNVSPCTYNVLDSYNSIHYRPCLSSISRKGYSGLARFRTTVQHNEKMPAPCDYSPSVPFYPEKKEAKAPFSSTLKRRTFLTNKNPGPGAHNPYKQRQTISFNRSFGGRVQMCLPVELKCCSRNTDVCKICEETPFGDYWHWNNQVFLCRPCMIEEGKIHSQFKRNELSKFRRLRDCSRIHSHEGTAAKVWLTHPKEIVKWAQREAYLSSFLPD
ncbi:uncharacterized protein LOC117168985 isoform X2 [Belonocnema kinseyi]|uniref:uncharacterized protein LOC117168985 isoform X2 n=1 Tax=Belonocnema kinseyi TaxID=2817044 RepID=UPI00143CE5D4|nr:uncharacterized protein LOC117168985 isoform X2 [Belonocnema kinseyi]